MAGIDTVKHACNFHVIIAFYPTFNFLGFVCTLREFVHGKQLGRQSANSQSKSDGVECLIKTQHVERGPLMHVTQAISVEELKSHITRRVIRTLLIL